ncbi:MAG: glycosyltransferase [Cyanobacteria bacterium P01_F01_bin.150]
MNSVSDSELNNIIAPEIKNDDFYQAIQRFACDPSVKTVLEIGSSSGQGSTEAFVKGLRKNPNSPQLFCMEVSKPRFESLKSHYESDSFVHCYNVSSVDLEAFPDPLQVEQFYHSKQTPLNQYPVEQVVGWLQQDVNYVRNSGVSANGIQLIKKERNIERFDLVLIDGSEFTGEVELEQVYGSKFILLDDICTYKNYNSHHRLLNDPNYVLIEQNIALRNGYSIFERVEQYPILRSPQPSQSDMPIHFFTIVLNGEPFIRYHLDVLKQLPFRWHWHIVEGVAALKHDTAWSVDLGGQVIDDVHHQGRSHDGTKEYLDELAEAYPDSISIYRKPEGEFWDGKREMVNAPLQSIQEGCLLWQIDVDELWTVEQINTLWQMFVDRPDKTAAYFWCNYFVGEQLIISSRNCYAQNPAQEWLRVWRYEPGMKWAAHEPPKLVRVLPNGDEEDVAGVKPFLHAETLRANLVFQHFAYVTEMQLKFKESYYGYSDAVAQWKTLQQQQDFPVLLRDYFGWVDDDTLVEPAQTSGIVPLLAREPESDNWTFLTFEEMQHRSQTIKKPFPQIVIDGVFFQFGESGIAQVWRSLMKEWVKTGFAEHLVILDRDGTAPRIPGLRYRPVRAYDYDKTAADAEMLQEICDEKGADLFISSYYTTPLTTPSVFMAYDMIPEVIGADLTQTGWKEKHLGIVHASSYITISQSTAKDLCQFFPAIDPETVTVAHCGIKQVFSPASPDEIQQVRAKIGVDKPYFLMVGDRTGVNGYKNAVFFFRALSQLLNKSEFAVVCVGGQPQLEPELQTLSDGIETVVIGLSDEDLKAAYSGAIALVYPSLYEGFGLPIAEAMACGCPVITGRHSSIPEVGGDAVIYVDTSSINELIDALYKVQHPEIRQHFVQAGFEQCAKFSWENMAKIVSQVLLDTGKQLENQSPKVGSYIWETFRKLQRDGNAIASDISSNAGNDSHSNVSTIRATDNSLLERIQSLEGQLQEKANTLQHLEGRLQEKEGRTQELETQLSKASSQLLDAEGTIAAMKTSKFWRLRSASFKIRRALGLPTSHE